MAQEYAALPRNERNEVNGYDDTQARGNDCRNPHLGHRQPLTLRSVLLMKDIVLMLIAVLGLLATFEVITIPKDDTTISQNKYQAFHVEGLGQGSVSGRESCKCGDTVAEAIANGCKYDSMGVAWLPDHCRDDELTSEFDRSGDGPNGEWTYWAEFRGSETITLEQISERADNKTFRIFMIPEWHVVHCLFYWRKEHRFRLNGKTLDPRFNTEEHIKHCISVIRDGPGPGTEASVSTNADMA
ncbi:hypothetical protein ABKA04_003727 [Annulohypoxylon sp. FPYF3050]